MNCILSIEIDILARTTISLKAFHLSHFRVFTQSLAMLASMHTDYPLCAKMLCEHQVHQINP